MLALHHQRSSKALQRPQHTLPPPPRVLLTHGLSIQNGWGLALSGSQLLIGLLNTRLLKLAEDEE